MPASAGRAVCRCCGISILLPGDGGVVAAAVVERRNRPPVLAIFLLTIAALLIGLFLVGRMVYRTLEAHVLRAQCAAQLHKISVALQNYADQNSVYPPAIMRDAQGRPLHSWRVLILPHLGKEEEELHKEYRYDEPWDGPHNRELAKRMPAAYRCPEDPGALDSSTSYLAIVDATTGEFAAYPTGGSNAPPKKPPMTAYLVVESADSGINWLEPNDIALGANGQPAKPLPANFGYHLGGSQAVDEDGATVVLPDADLVKAIVTPPNKNKGS
jgi:hypothetical protein